jgi:hypothetical protein
LERRDRGPLGLGVAGRVLTCSPQAASSRSRAIRAMRIPFDADPGLDGSGRALLRTTFVVGTSGSQGMRSGRPSAPS